MSQKTKVKIFQTERKEMWEKDWILPVADLENRVNAWLEAEKPDVVSVTHTQSGEQWTEKHTILIVYKKEG